MPGSSLVPMTVKFPIPFDNHNSQTGIHQRTDLIKTFWDVTDFYYVFGDSGLDLVSAFEYFSWVGLSELIIDSSLKGSVVSQLQS